MNDVIDKNAQDYLKQFVSRVEKLEEDKKTIQEDLKELYLEAKGQGFDTKILKQVIKLRKIDQAKLSEQEEILDLYKHALGMV